MSTPSPWPQETMSPTPTPPSSCCPTQWAVKHYQHFLNLSHVEEETFITGKYSRKHCFVFLPGLTIPENNPKIKGISILAFQLLTIDKYLNTWCKTLAEFLCSPLTFKESSDILYALTHMEGYILLSVHTLWQSPAWQHFSNINSTIEAAQKHFDTGHWQAFKKKSESKCKKT